MAEPYLWLREELEPAAEGALGATISGPSTHFVFSGTRLWLGGTRPPLAGFQGPD